MAAYIAHDSIEEVSGYRLATRNFYGTLAIKDEPAPDDTGTLRVLVNGSIRHGGQLAAPAHRDDPTMYYGPDSGVGRAITVAGRAGPIRVGVIGLGAGTLACYGRAGDVYVFYEINPLVVRLASTEFSFLRDSRAGIEVVPGDGRLSLEQYTGPPFDVLVLDAFAGDSVPMHLATREAFALYVRRLAPAGILALQITNQYVDLKPVVRAAASALGLHAVVVSTHDQRFPFHDSTWALLSQQAGRFETPAFARSHPLTAAPVTWTDDHANLLSVLKR
jgi:SAM-dependent methyltransferase